MSNQEKTSEELFNDTEEYSKTALDIDHEAQVFFSQLYDKYPDHKVRVISHIATKAALSAEAQCLVRRRNAKKGE
jgi:hypothetical protein